MAEVVPIKSVKRGRRKPRYTLLQKKQISEAVWRSDLPLYERLVLFELVDRTVAWGRVSKEATVKDLTARLGVSKSTLRRATTELQARGLLVVYSGKLNGYCNVYEPVVERIMSLLKVPKHKKNQSPDQGGVVPTEPGGGSNRARVISISTDKPSIPSGKTKRQSPPSEPAGDASNHPASVARATEEARRKNKASRERRRKRSPASALRVEWEDAHADFGFGPPVGWGHRAAAVKLIIDRFPEGDEQLRAMFRWAVQNWRSKMNGAFSWMNDWPAQPSIDIMSRNLERVVTAWRGGKVEVVESAGTKTSKLGRRV